jgi:putative ABC transport system permease protein
VLDFAVGAVMVLSSLWMTFVEGTRLFGVVAAIGWSRRRVTLLVLSEALTIGLLGAMLGVGLTFAATEVIGRLPSLVGILDPIYTADAFWRALYTAAAMSFIGGAYPALRAAFLAPLEALRRE